MFLDFSPVSDSLVSLLHHKLPLSFVFEKFAFRVVRTFGFVPSPVVLLLSVPFSLAHCFLGETDKATSNWDDASCSTNERKFLGHPKPIEVDPQVFISSFEYLLYSFSDAEPFPGGASPIEVPGP